MKANRKKVLENYSKIKVDRGTTLLSSFRPVAKSALKITIKNILGRALGISANCVIVEGIKTFNTAVKHCASARV